MFLNVEILIFNKFIEIILNRFMQHKNHIHIALHINILYHMTCLYLFMTAYQ